MWIDIWTRREAADFETRVKKVREISFEGS
jgi:hypothetical protein